MPKLPISSLVLNWDLYPRTQVDPHNVKSIVGAIQVGDQLPPIVVCSQTKQIIDGYHRYHAYRKEKDDHYEVEVQMIAYKDDSARLLDSVKRNARHGRRLATFEKIKAFAKLKNMRIAQNSIASALGVPVADLKAMALGRTATAIAKDGSLEDVPLKRTISHMSGKELTGTQIEANDKLGGSEALFYVNQIILLCESDLVDLENENLMAGLQKLSAALETLLTASA